MKTVKLNNAELSSIVIEALINSHAICSGDKDDCNLSKKWEVQTAKDNKKQIILKTDEWQTLDKYISKKPLNYQMALRLVICLGEQLAALTEAGFGISHITTADVTVMGDGWYLITNLSNVIPLYKKNMLRIVKPIQKNDFVAPELKKITALPSIVDQSCGFYSIAVVCLKSLGLKNDKEGLYHLFSTPLFFLLERCLNEIPDKRVFLLI